MVFYEEEDNIIKIIDALLNNLQEAICITDKNYIVRYWNKYADKLYNIQRDEIVGKKIDLFFPNAIALDVAKSKKIYKDVYHSPREGSHIIINAAPIIIDGEFKGVISTEKDISDIRSINEELEKIRERAEFLEEEILRITGKWNSIESKNKKMQTMMEIAR
jgi:PAS domain S-box-containing protein